MENKPVMYHNKIDKRINNNMFIYNSKMSDDKNNIISSDDIRQKINNIINSYSFIYSKLVNIVIGDDIIQRRIIGVYNNNLVTTLNEHILIDKIKDIYI